MSAWYEAWLPTTDAALYDILRELFGIGSFDEIASDNERWHEARGREIAKLRAQRQARRVDPQMLALAAYYCHAHGITILYPSQLYGHITTAARAAKRGGMTNAGIEGYDEAIEYERHQPNSPWLSRLLRATGQAHRQQTLDEWKKARQ